MMEANLPQNAVPGYYDPGERQGAIMATQKFIVKKTSESPVGNSMCWSYAYGEYLEFWHSEHPDWVIAVEGDWEGKLVGFIADGKDSKFLGELKPPRNPARAVFWRNGIYISKERFHYNETTEGLEKAKRDYWDLWYDDNERVQSKVPGSCWYNYNPVEIADPLTGQLCAVALLSRDWYHQWWHVDEIIFGKGAPLEYCAEKILGAIRSH